MRRSWPAFASRRGPTAGGCRSACRTWRSSAVYLTSSKTWSLHRRRSAMSVSCEAVTIDEQIVALGRQTEAAVLRARAPDRRRRVARPARAASRRTQILNRPRVPPLSTRSATEKCCSAASPASPSSPSSSLFGGLGDAGDAGDAGIRPFSCAAGRDPRRMRIRRPRLRPVRSRHLNADLAKGGSNPPEGIAQLLGQPRTIPCAASHPPAFGD